MACVYRDVLVWVDGPKQEHPKVPVPIVIDLNHHRHPSEHSNVVRPGKLQSAWAGANRSGMTMVVSPFVE